MKRSLPDCLISVNAGEAQHIEMTVDTIKDTEYKLKPGLVLQVYHAPFTTRARGVAILFRNAIPFLLKSKSIDPNGRFILIFGHINSLSITLLNIYGPNCDDPTFYQNIF